jgi:hypothetical protein
MYFKYHRLITREALRDNFGTTALKAVVKANVSTDDLISNFFNPEQHFVDNRIESSWAYIQAQRDIVVKVLKNKVSISRAWRAFGRLLHTAQDFYSHSNYVRLWADRFTERLPPADQIEAMDWALLKSPELHTVRPYRPMGSLGNIPVVGRWLFPFLPVDAHARMCLDSESSGPLFEYAYHAAFHRTQYEYREMERVIMMSGGGECLSLFLNQENQ